LCEFALVAERLGALAGDIWLNHADLRRFDADSLLKWPPKSLQAASLKRADFLPSNT
jgi:hypothetical protein